MRRTGSGSRLAEMLHWALMPWRDLYNPGRASPWLGYARRGPLPWLVRWTRGHAGLDGRSPAMALGLAEAVRSVRRYVAYPVHVSDPEREA